MSWPNSIVFWPKRYNDFLWELLPFEHLTHSDKSSNSQTVQDRSKQYMEKMSILSRSTDSIWFEVKWSYL